MPRAWRTGGDGNKLTDITWKPRVTVAACCEREGRYLMVEESVAGRTVYNQPAGHLEPGETLLEAVTREMLEETRYRFVPAALVGVYRYTLTQDSDTTYLRFLFRGEAIERVAGDLDPEIIAAKWMDYDEIVACRKQHRTPMVLQCIDDARSGKSFPLQVISEEFA